MFAPLVATQQAKPAAEPHRRPAPRQCIGNQANLRRLAGTAAGGAPALPGPVQRKLVVGDSNDPLEHEADRVAAEVLRMPDPTGLAAAPPPVGPRGAAFGTVAAPALRPKRPEASEAGGGEAPGSVHAVLATPGQPLDAGARAFFEPRLGRDLSDVRIHADAQAAASASAVDARAYTVGRHIAFAQGEYRAGTPAGLRLMAHELAHVMQQTSPALRREAAPPPAPPPAPAALHWSPSINLALRPVTSTNPVVSEAQKLGLQELDALPDSAWPHLDWGKVSVGAANRILHPELMDQGVLGLCGPAAALNAEALLAPVSYAKLVVQVFSTGKVANHAVNDTLKGGSPPGAMDQSDWMLMSAIQDVNNAVFDYYGRGDADEKRVRDAHTTGQVEADMKATGCVKTTTNPCYVSGEVELATKVSDLLRAHPTDLEVVMFVSAGILQGTPNSGSKPNHFIRLTEPMTITEPSISFKAFTWGAIHAYTFATEQFRHLVSAFVLGARNDAIPL